MFRACSLTLDLASIIELPAGATVDLDRTNATGACVAGERIFVVAKDIVGNYDFWVVVVAVDEGEEVERSSDEESRWTYELIAPMTRIFNFPIVGRTEPEYYFPFSRAAVISL